MATEPAKTETPKTEVAKAAPAAKGVRSSLTLRQSPEAINWVLVVLIIGLSGYTAWAAWQALTNPEIPQPIDTVAASPTPTPATELKLNIDHERQGKEVVVDPSLIGRPNPFANP